MHQKNLGVKRKLETSNETRFSGLPDASTASQHAVSNSLTTTGLAATVDANMGHHPERNAGGEIAGYIFMCNTKTKPDCYIYRVFGLPAHMLGVVERIKPNTKLFLYDFELKLLYGLYVADGVGKLALEPHAFGGRFPAQVKFSIAKDCLPLPVAAFKDTINHIGTKFKQDLSHEQVDRLVSLFRPVTVSPHQAPLSFHSAAKDSYHDVIRHPVHHHVQEVPRQSPHSQIALARGVELASGPCNPPLSYGRYASARSHQAYISPPQLQAVTPSSAKQSSSLTAAQWVAVAANAQISEDPSSFKQPSISGTGASPANSNHSGSRYTEAGYGNRKWRSSGTHEAVSVPSEPLVRGCVRSQGDSAFPNGSQLTSSEVGTNSTSVSYGPGNQPYGNYHQMPTVSIHQEVNNVPDEPPIAGYVQSQSDPALPYTSQSASSEVGANSTSVSYGPGIQPYANYHQTPTVSVHQEVNSVPNEPLIAGYVQSQSNPSLPSTSQSTSSIVGVNSTSVSYGPGNQPNGNHHQTPTVRTDLEVNNVPSEPPVPGHVQSQGDPALSYTSHSASGDVVANSTGVSYGPGCQPFGNYHQLHAATIYQEVSHVPSQPPVLGDVQRQGDPALPYTSHSASGDVSANSAGVSYGPGYQPFGNYHQMHAATIYQEVSNMPSQPPVPGDVQRQGDPALPYTSHSASGDVSANSAGVSYGPGYQPFGNYHQMHAASVHQEVANVPNQPPVPGYVQSIGDPALPYTSESVTSVNGANSTGVSYGPGYQPYGNYYQTPAVSMHQEVNNFHASNMPLAYAPAYYVNQQYPYSLATVPEGSAGYGYENQGYAGYYQAPLAPSNQGVGGTHYFPSQAYENNSYVQSQGAPPLPQTLPSGTGEVVNYAHPYPHQGYYYSSHQMTPMPPHQELNVAPAQVSEAHPIQ